MSEKFELKPISLHPLQAYLTDNVQLFEIVEQILKQIGIAKITVTSFSISEEFIRKMWRLKQQNLIKSMDLVIDRRAAKKILNILPFANNVFDNIYLSHNHSKVLLLENEEYKVSVCTSQNQTRGNRYEGGVICSCSNIFAYYQLAIIKLKEQSIHVNEIFREPT